MNPETSVSLTSWDEPYLKHSLSATPTSGIEEISPKALRKALYDQEGAVALRTGLQDWALQRALEAHESGDSEAFAYAQEIYEAAKTTVGVLSTAESPEILEALDMRNTYVLGKVALSSMYQLKPVEDPLKLYPEKESEKIYKGLDQVIIEKDHLHLINNFKNF